MLSHRLLQLGWIIPISSALSDLANFDADLADDYLRNHSPFSFLRWRDAMEVHPYSVLVVDTDAESLFSIDRALSEHGFRVHSANNVDQAISIGIRERIDLLVSRFRLDVGTAIVLAMRLRAVKRLSGMPALFLCEHQHAGVVLRTTGATPEYSLRYPAKIPVLVQLANLTISCQKRSHFEKSIAPPIPTPYAPFPGMVERSTTNFI